MTDHDADIWNDDTLGRKADAVFLYSLIIGRAVERRLLKKPGAFVVNVDAQWGQGKTFFLKRMYEQVIRYGHPAVFIDAWEFDFVDDPYTMVVSSLEEYFRELETAATGETREVIKTKTTGLLKSFGKISLIVGKELLKTTAKRYTGGAMEQISDYFEGVSETDENAEADDNEYVASLEKSINDLSDAAIDKFAQTRLDNINETKKSSKQFKKGFAEIIGILSKDLDKKPPFFVFVDELDRCKPTYALAMLERIKHLFDVTEVVFVMATDTTQLAHSIKAVYGSEFNSKEYLGRFFHRSYKLPEPTYEQFASNFLQVTSERLDRWKLPSFSNRRTSIENVCRFLSLTAKKFKLTLRQFEQSMDVLNDITTLSKVGLPIELVYLYPYICVYALNRDLDETAFTVIQRTTSSGQGWNYVTDKQPIQLQDYFNEMHVASNDTLNGAMRTYGTKASIEGSSEASRYVYHMLINENDHRDKNEIDFRQPPEIGNYTHMIMHVKRLHSE